MSSSTLLRSLQAMAEAGGDYFKGIHTESLRQQRIKEAQAMRAAMKSEERAYQERTHQQRRTEQKVDRQEAIQDAEESNLKRLKDTQTFKEENPSHKGLIQAVGPDGVLRYYKQDTNGELVATELVPKGAAKGSKGSGSSDQNSTQLKVEGYLSRMENASELLNEVPYDSTGVQGLSDKLLTQSDGTNFMASSKGQQYKTLAAEWIRAKLRKESGAVIGEAEMAEEYRTYFPQPGDKDDVIKYKAKLRKHAEASLRLEAGIDSGMSKAATDYVQKYLN